MLFILLAFLLRNPRYLVLAYRSIGNAFHQRWRLRYRRLSRATGFLLFRHFLHLPFLLVDINVYDKHRVVVLSFCSCVIYKRTFESCVRVALRLAPCANHSPSFRVGENCAIAPLALCISRRTSRPAVPATAFCFASQRDDV